MSVLIIAGPTASGKTRLGAELAKRLDGEVISCDSMQIYRDIPICSAAPTREEMQGIPHHLIGFLPFNAAFTVVDYREAARKKVRDILARGKQPIFVGGTGLYVHSLLYEPDFAGGFDETLRRSLDALPNEELYARLQKADKDTKISPGDRKRMLRALEVYMLTGKTPQQGSSWRKKSTEFDYKLFCISPPREVLYERINCRVEEMLAAGMEEEIRRLHQLGINETHQCYKAIGCRQLIEYFEGKITREQAVEKIKTESRRYAKRQLTWMRGEEAIWLEGKNPLEKILEEL